MVPVNLEMGEQVFSFEIPAEVFPGFPVGQKNIEARRGRFNRKEVDGSQMRESLVKKVFFRGREAQSQCKNKPTADDDMF